LHKGNGIEWIKKTEILIKALPNESVANIFNKLILARSNPVFHELIRMYKSDGVEKVLSLLKHTTLSHETMTFLWCRQLTRTTDPYCLYNELKHLFFFFDETENGRKMLGLVLAVLPRELNQFALKQTFEKRLSIRKILDTFEQYILDRHLDRHNYKELVGQMNKLKAGVKHETMQPKPVAVPSATQTKSVASVSTKQSKSVAASSATQQKHVARASTIQPKPKLFAGPPAKSVATSSMTQQQPVVVGSTKQATYGAASSATQQKLVAPTTQPSHAATSSASVAGASATQSKGAKTVQAEVCALPASVQTKPVFAASRMSTGSAVLVPQQMMPNGGNEQTRRRAERRLRAKLRASKA
jgi:hypothetical protein